MKSTNLIQETLRDFVFADCRLVDSSKIRASVFLKQGEELKLAARTPVERKSPLSFPLSEGLAGKVFASKSYGLYPRLEASPKGDWLLKQAPNGHEIMRSLLSVPILSGQQALGVIN